MSAIPGKERGREVTRLEALSDAVFGFAATVVVNSVLIYALLGPLCHWNGTVARRRSWELEQRLAV